MKRATTYRVIRHPNYHIGDRVWLLVVSPPGRGEYVGGQYRTRKAAQEDANTLTEMAKATV